MVDSVAKLPRISEKFQPTAVGQLPQHTKCLDVGMLMNALGLRNLEPKFTDHWRNVHPRALVTGCSQNGYRL